MSLKNLFKNLGFVNYDELSNEIKKLRVELEYLDFKVHSLEGQIKVNSNQKLGKEISKKLQSQEELARLNKI